MNGCLAVLCLICRAAGPLRRAVALAVAGCGSARPDAGKVRPASKATDQHFVHGQPPVASLYLTGPNFSDGQRAATYRFNKEIFMTMTTTASGLQYEDTVLGTGAIAKAGQRVKVHYTGWLYNGGVQGQKFDSSKDRGQPFQFSLGAGEVIRGWDEGVQGMSAGGTRRLVIPAELGYGARGAGGAIPPNATLMFDVDFLGT